MAATEPHEDLKSEEILQIRLNLIAIFRIYNFTDELDVSNLSF